MVPFSFAGEEMALAAGLAGSLAGVLAVERPEALAKVIEGFLG